MYIFLDKNEIDSPRATFANNVCKLLVDKYKGDLKACLPELKIIFDDFEENVRNIYELIDRQIPLFAHYKLETIHYSDLGLTEEEYLIAKYNTSIACLNYYR